MTKYNRNWYKLDNLRTKKQELPTGGSFFCISNTVSAQKVEFCMKSLHKASILVLPLLLSSPVFAQSADVLKVQNFITSIVQTLVLLAGTLATAFFVWGGVRYITSSGNPETLEGAKKTIIYSAIGLTICLAAFVITNIVTQFAQGAFGN